MWALELNILCDLALDPMLEEQQEERAGSQELLRKCKNWSKDFIQRATEENETTKNQQQQRRWRRRQQSSHAHHLPNRNWQTQISKYMKNSNVKKGEQQSQ